MNKSFDSGGGGAIGRQPGYSLIFAFLIMTVIMIIAGTTIENTQDKVRYFSEMDGTSQARLAAESAAELAVVQIRDYEAGYDPGEDSEAFCLEDSGGDCVSYGGYEVRGVAEVHEDDPTGSYYVPILGTGTAGLSDECSILNDHEDVDHPCNWNKLMYGESVTVPLYVSDGTETGAYVPADLGFSSWQLKIRTPCSDESCSSRYAFSPTSEEENDTIILWQLVGETSSGNVSLIPNDAVGRDWMGDETKAASSDNTEVYEDLIDDASDRGDYIVLDTDDFSELSSFVDDSSLISLALQLDIVSQLVDSGGNAIPYLEWQLEINSSSSFADNKTSIIGTGYHEGQSGTFYFPYVITRSSTGESASIYTLSN